MPVELIAKSCKGLYSLPNSPSPNLWLNNLWAIPSNSSSVDNLKFLFSVWAYSSEALITLFILPKSLAYTFIGDEFSSTPSIL